MSTKFEKILIGGLIIVTVGGITYTVKTSKTPPTVKTEIIQTDEGTVKVDYQQMILSELHQETSLVIASNKIELPVTQTEKHWYGNKKQDINFYAIGRYSIDLSKITEDNVIVNDSNRTITIYISKPVKNVELLENETQFSEVEKGFFVWGNIKYTFEEVESMKYQVKCDMLVKMEDLMGQVKESASNSIQRMLLSITGNKYSVKVIFIE